jgi:penicillin-insensitive murein endopeptidase
MRHQRAVVARDGQKMPDALRDDVRVRAYRRKSAGRCRFFGSRLLIPSFTMGLVRAVLAVSALAFAVLGSGCAELGVVTDGSSISYGRPSRGRLIDGAKLPDQGPGYVTPETWKTRGNRYGTNELVTLIKGVAKRMRKKSRDARLVVADLSGNNGGESRKFHRSHQSGRDVDLMYYVRDAEGKVLEPDVMHTFDATLTAKDGSGMKLDVPRTWALVRELLTAQEAYVQYIFMYRPIAEALIDHATKTKESPALIARATKALKQPGDSAPHNDHMHVRVYCAATDRMFGCQDIGPLELLAEREEEARQAVEMIASSLPPAPDLDDTENNEAIASAVMGPSAGTTALADASGPRERTAADVWKEVATTPTVASTSVVSPSFSSLLRASSHRIDLRSWR